MYNDPKMFPPPTQLLECGQLFNLLNAENFLPRLSDPNYLYLIDCRPRKDYEESHVITAHHLKREREQIITYPNEICPQLVYLGRRAHAINSTIVKDLKIRAYVNCTKYDDYLVQGADALKYFRMSVDDKYDAPVSQIVHDAVMFIAVAYDRGDPVLVYSDRGISRAAAVVTAFISFRMRMTSTEALQYVMERREVRPQSSFISCIDELNNRLHNLKETMEDATVRPSMISQTSILKDLHDEQSIDENEDKKVEST
ncbi:unnamed protein product [Didymodactylos carnosus]|uniref:Tyrosine-protein phosphatase domain-containing protein n=1 Tax=Didymodactylos carnosus TaxID=1234261 RepID=A0A813YKH0_9BILA|nr:unnamed protein product [Didymodactylos carnosus]CAF0906601.1 unnamed protein product [Didymodactylos carnosus]CAF3670893.1 unnamed protein product [Didymodactylos carnosus]CAF3686390.1 unnamed protein product [Didymodactylos carnosus]